MNLAEFFQSAWSSRDAIVAGLQYTVFITISAVAIGTIVGILIGVALVYGNVVVRFLARVYTDFIRGTPVLVLILASFYILSVVGINLTAVQAGVFALAVFAASHVAEMVRGALLAIPKGQTEAAKAIGLTFRQNFTYVLMPQALRQILPTWVNAAAEILKASTLLSIIGVGELLLSTQRIISRNFDISLELYFMAGVLYFLLGFSVERLGGYVERKVSVG